MDARQFRSVGRPRPGASEGSRRPRRGRALRVEGLEGRQLLSGVVSDVVSLPAGVTAGVTTVALGDLWVAEVSGQGASAGTTKLAKVNVAGGLTQVSLPGSTPRTIRSMVGDSPGDVWYAATEPAQSGATPVGLIGKVAPDGTVTEYPLPSGDQPGAMATTNNGSVYVAVSHDGQAPTIDKVAPDGTLTPNPVTGASQVAWLTATPDGTLWFVDGSKIGKMTTSGAVTEFTLPSTGGGGAPDLSNAQLTPTSNGDVDFIGFGGIVQVTPSGSVNTYSTPGAYVTALRSATDGNVWFSFVPVPGGQYAGASGAVVGRLNADGTTTLVPDRVDGTGTPVVQMAAGHDLGLWLNDGATKISRLTISSLPTVSIPIIKPTTTTYFTIAPGQTFSGAIVSFAPYTLSGASSSYTATINWGDGHVTQGTVTANSNGGYDVDGAHTYNVASGSWLTVSVTVTDANGNTANIFNRVDVQSPSGTGAPPSGATAIPIATGTGTSTATTTTTTTGTSTGTTTGAATGSNTSTGSTTSASASASGSGTSTGTWTTSTPQVAGSVTTGTGGSGGSATTASGTTGTSTGTGTATATATTVTTTAAGTPLTPRQRAAAAAAARANARLAALEARAAARAQSHVPASHARATRVARPRHY
jgi:hypothetical protein